MRQDAELRLPTSTDWHEHGIERELAGDLRGAVESYRRALRAGATNVQVVFDLAHALTDLGHVEAAIERYRQVTEAAPQRSDAWCNLGQLLLEIGEIEGAVSCLSRAVALEPTDYAARFNLARATNAWHPQARCDIQPLRG